MWADPAPGKWQLIVWAPGFSGNGFSEPYRGVVTVVGGSVAPGAWTATAAPGETATMDFTVANDGPTDLAGLRRVHGDVQRHGRSTSRCGCPTT